MKEAESQGFLGPGVSLVSGRSRGDELGQVRDGWGRACPVHWECGCRIYPVPAPWSTLSALPWVKHNVLSASILEGSGTFSALP